MTQNKYKIYFNEDCSKYGMLNEHNHQIMFQKKELTRKVYANDFRVKCYTKQKATAEKWLEKLNSGEFAEFSY